MNLFWTFWPETFDLGQKEPLLTFLVTRTAALNIVSGAEVYARLKFLDRSGWFPSGQSKHCLRSMGTIQQ